MILARLGGHGARDPDLTVGPCLLTTLVHGTPSHTPLSHETLGKPSIVTPPRPPFMKSLFIYFFVHFLSEKKDDFEGCLKGVDGCFKGV